MEKIWNETEIREKQIQGIFPLDTAGDKVELIEIRRNRAVLARLQRSNCRRLDPRSKN